MDGEFVTPSEADFERWLIAAFEHQCELLNSIPASERVAGPAGPTSSRTDSIGTPQIQVGGEV
jgi:hypothetical protein